MSNNTKVNLFKEELVLVENRLYFCDHLIHDFNDKFSNCSSVGMEDQNKQFLLLVKMIFEASLSSTHRAETVIILANLFHVLSGRNSPTDIMLLGESSFTGVYEYVLNRFHPDNKLFELCPKKELEPELVKNLQYIAISSDYNLNTLPKDLLNEHRYGIILIDYDAVQNSLPSLVDACSKLIRKSGKLVCIGSGWYDPEHMAIPEQFEGNLYQLGEERFVLVLDINTPTFTRKEEVLRTDLLPILHNKREILITRINSLLHPPEDACIADWHRRADEAILISAELETLIRDNSILLSDGDLKYKANEVKNALLDLKYEVLLSRKDFSFFRDLVVSTISVFRDAVY